MLLLGMNTLMSMPRWSCFWSYKGLLFFIAFVVGLIGIGRLGLFILCCISGLSFGFICFNLGWIIYFEGVEGFNLTDNKY